MGAQPNGSFTVSATEDEPEGEMSPALVQARDLFKIYREGSVETVALRSASLELPRGQITSLVGPSGSGKSTLLSILAGLALPSAGQVLFDAEDITRLDEAGRARLRARRIGMVQQSGNLIPFLSALENVKLALTLAGAQPQAARRAPCWASWGGSKTSPPPSAALRRRGTAGLDRGRPGQPARPAAGRRADG
jgi:ABC-type glutathione transport system ATPase component